MTLHSTKNRAKEDRVQRPPVQQQDPTIEQVGGNETKQSQYPSASTRPSEGFVLEIDGKFGSEYGTLTGALKAGLELRQKFPHSQVKMIEENEQTLANG
jgi:hypothetical protein